MRLATPQAVLGVLGIQTGTGALTTAGAALDATFGGIESRLDCRLTLREQVDYFTLSKYDAVDPVLRLATGFVNTDEAFTVGLLGSDAPLPVDAYHLDPEKGTVSVYGEYTPGKDIFTVHYTSGFDVSTSDPLQFVDVPDVLKQAHTSLACAYVQTNPANVPKEKARFLGVTSIIGYQQQAHEVLAPYVRPRGTCVWTSRTVLIV